MGASGCGKSTLEQQLLTGDDVYRVVSTSTRDMRRGEIQDTTYHFVSKLTFNTLEGRKEFIQTTTFGDHRYGTTKSEYTTEHAIAVLSLVPESAVTFIPILQKEFPDYNIKIVYFDISTERLRMNMSVRGDSDKAIALRMSHDNLAEQFEEAGFVPDLRLTDLDLTPNVGQLVRDTLKI